MKILILGVNGFIGNALTRRILATRDWEVFGMDLYSNKLDRALDLGFVPGFLRPAYPSRLGAGKSWFGTFTGSLTKVPKDRLLRIGFGKVTVRWSQLGFGRTSSTSTSQATPRNLFGFKDGTRNLKAEETDELAFFHHDPAHSDTDVDALIEEALGNHRAAGGGNRAGPPPLARGGGAARREAALPRSHRLGAAPRNDRLAQALLPFRRTALHACPGA